MTTSGRCHWPREIARKGESSFITWRLASFVIDFQSRDVLVLREHERLNIHVSVVVGDDWGGGFLATLLANNDSYSSSHIRFKRGEFDIDNSFMI